MKAELVQMLVNEHLTEVKKAETENEEEDQLAMMTKPVMEEVNKEEESSEDTESEEEEDVTKPGSAQPAQVIYIPPALQPQPFDPTAVAR